MRIFDEQYKLCDSIDSASIVFILGILRRLRRDWLTGLAYVR